MGWLLWRLTANVGLNELNLYWPTIMCIVANPKNMWGFVKPPSSLKCSFFHTLSFFPIYCIFPKRSLHTLIKEFTWAGKRKRKRKGKVAKRQWHCLARTIFDAKSYRFRYRLVVRESCVCSSFSGNGIIKNQWPPTRIYHLPCAESDTQRGVPLQ